MEILFRDDRVLVCVKPAGIRSTDGPGGLPELLRNTLGDPTANLRTVHRLDQAVSGLMVLACTARAAADLSAQIRDGVFEKEYLAVCHGDPGEQGVMQDLLRRDAARRMTFCVKEPGPDTRPARLEYKTLGSENGLTLVRIRLQTGRTHQIRAQFAARGLPLAGDRKYGMGDGFPGIGLWSFRLAFRHPRTGEAMSFTALPPEIDPWLAVKDFLPENATGNCFFDGNRV